MLSSTEVKVYIHEPGTVPDPFGDRDIELRIPRGKQVDVEVEATDIKYTQGFADLDFEVSNNTNLLKT